MWRLGTIRTTMVVEERGRTLCDTRKGEHITNGVLDTLNGGRGRETWVVVPR